MIAPEIDLRLPADSLGFVRRECPACRRQFKTRRRDFDGRVLMRRLGASVTHENAADIYLGFGEKFACFYCGKVAPADDYLTAGQKEFVEQLATSLVEHLRYEQLSRVIRNLADNPRPTFVPVKPAPLPELPKELEDMRPFPLTCCGEEAKGAAGWEQPFHCPSCGVKHARGGVAAARHRLQLTFVRE